MYVIIVRCNELERLNESFYLARDGRGFVSQVAKSCTRSRVLCKFSFCSQQMLIFLVLADNLFCTRDIVRTLFKTKATTSKNKYPQRNPTTFNFLRRLTFPNRPTAAIMFAQYLRIQKLELGLIKTKMKACKYL